jgi:hypothetical protein
MKTVYKNVLVGTKAYKRVMNQIGKCISGGGVVDMEHTQTITLDAFGAINNVNVIDVTLEW